jgi:putative SOS response-associated peptidase YedK
MKRFHRLGDEKRSLIVVRPEDYDDWLSCSDPERARSFFQLYPADRMRAEPAPKFTQPKAPEVIDDPARPPLLKARIEVGMPLQASLFD